MEAKQSAESDPTNASELRTAMKAYWSEHLKVASLETMMLDGNAAALDQDERPEIISMLPDHEECDVLELGAGIGRFTGSLAVIAASVTAVDFMKSALDINKAANAGAGNISFEQADVTELEVAKGSKDLIFSNWLFMYLSDTEVADVFRRALTWLRADGHLFFRESCFHRSGDVTRKTNPTKYRSPGEYVDLVRSVSLDLGDGTCAQFELVSCRCVAAYVKHKQNQNQVGWLWRRVVVAAPTPLVANGSAAAGAAAGAGMTLQRFLDLNQYTRGGILRYERIFGAGFVSTGGLQTTRQFVGRLQLQPGQHVLDVGCGIGGGDFFMASEYGVKVTGIDLSSNMVNIALERAVGLKANVQFEICDATTRDFADATFDVIYSRDSILHIEDKQSLFARFLRWLKPGGKLLISDYARSESATSAEFDAYVAQRGYHLLSVPAYGAVLEGVGFSEVQALDKTQLFMEVLQRELERAEKDKEGFIRDFSEADYDYIVSGWRAKLRRSADGDQVWGLFVATKAVAGE